MSKKNIQPLKTITSIIGIYVILGGSSYGQAAWNLQLEPMYMGVAGADNHQANITTTTTTYPYSSGSPLFTLDPQTFQPIIISRSSATTSQNFDMGDNVTFRGQLEYMRDDWGVGVSGWWFDTSNSINQNLNSSSPSAFTSSSFTVSTINYTSNNFSLYAPPSNFGSLEASAKSSLGVWNIDAYGIKNLGDFQNGRINMTFGVKFGGIENKISEAVVEPGLITGSSFPEGATVLSSQQNGSAANSANANFLVGPSLGIQGFGKYGKHRLEGLLSQSVLIGNVNRKTNTINSETNAIISYQYPFNNIITNTYITNLNLSDSETVAIPVTEMKIKYMYNVTENISLGAGFFASVWVDAPTAPNAQLNDRQYNTLFFYGGLTSINFIF